MEGLGEMSPPIFGLPFGAFDNPANSSSRMDSHINRVVMFNRLVLSRLLKTIREDDTGKRVHSSYCFGG